MLYFFISLSRPQPCDSYFYSHLHNLIPPIQQPQIRINFFLTRLTHLFIRCLIYLQAFNFPPPNYTQAWLHRAISSNLASVNYRSITALKEAHRSTHSSCVFYPIKSIIKIPKQVYNRNTIGLVLITWRPRRSRALGVLMAELLTNLRRG